MLVYRSVIVFFNPMVFVGKSTILEATPGMFDSSSHHPPLEPPDGAQVFQYISSDLQHITQDNRLEFLEKNIQIGLGKIFQRTWHPETKNKKGQKPCFCACNIITFASDLCLLTEQSFCPSEIFPADGCMEFPPSPFLRFYDVKKSWEVDQSATSNQRLFY